MKTIGTQHACTNTVKTSFTEVWNSLFPVFAENFRLNEAERAHFSENRTLQLIAYTPWLAGCAQKEKTALMNMSVYMISTCGSGKYFFDHTPADDISPVARLRPLMNFVGGDEAIIGRAINLLALQILCGYNRDRAKDAASGEYNPLNSGAWDFTGMKTRLESAITAVSCDEMDTVMDLDKSTRGHWR